MTLESFAKVNSLSWQSSSPEKYHETYRTNPRISDKRRPLYELAAESDVSPFSFDSQLDRRATSQEILSGPKEASAWLSSRALRSRPRHHNPIILASLRWV